MKTAIVYYSFSGNTHQLAQILSHNLRAKGDVDLFRLDPLDESKSFFGQCIRAFFAKKAKIREVRKDMSGYDLVCIGTPVWAFGPAPSVNKYFDICEGVAGKDILLFVTYGSGAGVGKCLDTMEAVFSKKGSGNIKKISVQQNKIKDPQSLSEQIKTVLESV